MVRRATLRDCEACLDTTTHIYLHSCQNLSRTQYAGQLPAAHALHTYFPRSIARLAYRRHSAWAARSRAQRSLAAPQSRSGRTACVAAAQRAAQRRTQREFEKTPTRTHTHTGNTGPPAATRCAALTPWRRVCPPRMRGRASTLNKRHLPSVLPSHRHRGKQWALPARPARCGHSISVTKGHQPSHAADVQTGFSRPPPPPPPVIT